MTLSHTTREKKVIWGIAIIQDIALYIFAKNFQPKQQN